MIGLQLTINADRDPGATALVYGTRRYSYTALNERSCRLANALTSLGVGRGDHVAGLMNNCSQFIEVFFALAKLGGVFVPLNFRLAPREIRQLLNDCCPKLLFVGESVAQAIAELTQAEPLLPQLILVPDRADSAPETDDGSYEVLLRSHSAEEPDVAVAREDLQLLLYSSGTTGRPKGALWTHGTTLASSTAKIIDFEIGRGDVSVVFGPLFHVGPLMDLAVPQLLRGGRLVIGATTGFDPATLMRTVADERATLVSVYPTMWRRLLALSDLDAYDCSTLRLLFTGGEPISISLLREIYARFPSVGFVNTYGSTEGGPITTFLPAQDRQRKIGSVGKPAFSVDVRLADETEMPVPVGTVGELLVRSPFVCSGYWNRSADPMPYRPGAWWHTGDMAWRDDEGFIWIAGRKKDMIISGAENIYPVEIEQVIAELEGVVDVAVVGVPDAEWGESVAAYVVSKDGSMLDASKIIDHCRRNLASYKKPRHIFFVEGLPRTTVNKVSKDKLREQFSQK